MIQIYRPMHYMNNVFPWEIVFLGLSFINAYTFLLW